MIAPSLTFKMLDRFRRTPPEQPRLLLPAYRHDSALRRNRKKLGLALFLCTIIFIMAFQLFGRFYAAPFLFPLGVMALLIIWALPETIEPPLNAVQGWFAAFLIALLIWPNYLAISLPGLPWITAVRMTGAPMMLFLLVALSVSVAFRSQLRELFATSRPMIFIMLAFIGVLCFSLLVSDSIAVSANKLVVAATNLIGVFFVSAFVFSKLGRAWRFVLVLWAATILLCLVAIWEWKLGRLPWAGHIPGFLAIDDEVVQRILAPGGRKATGVYRVQSRFNSPLSFAEFLALVTPFVLHIGLTAKRFSLRFAAMATLPLIFFLIVKTDSRLGMAGFLMAFVLYILAWSTFTWYRNKRSIFGPAVTIAYPVIFAIFIASTLLIRPLRLLVWGGGAHSASNAAREAQWAQGIPIILKRPWGYGMGEGGQALGFRGPSGTLTVDSYYLSVALDLGIIGLLVFVALFLTGIFWSATHAPRARSFEESLLVPITISLCIYMITKSVLSQAENQPLMFILLGMSVGLVWRIRKSGAENEARLSGLPPLHERS